MGIKHRKNQKKRQKGQPIETIKAAVLGEQEREGKKGDRENEG